MAWRTPRGFLVACGAQKFSKLTNEPTQQSPVGVGDGATTTFLTPFFYGQILPYFDGTLQTTGFTISRETGAGGRDQLVFSPAPGDGVVITASSPDGVNVDVYEAAAIAAQGDIRGCVDAVLYDAPTDDADTATIHPMVLKWFDVMTSYNLAGDLRRPGLLTAYKELGERYIDVYGGVDSTLKRIAKGTQSLRGVLPYRGVTSPPQTQGVGFSSSRPKVYTGGRGVF